jgi:UDP-N-acetylmuramoylalanine--D-glutamate ligase
VKDWHGKRVVVLGLARQGRALARYLAERGARVVVSDMKTAEALTESLTELADLPLEFVLGGHPPELIEGADLVCLSGGVSADLPLAQQAIRRGIRLANDSQLFLEECLAMTIGITGSAGKTTTTALVGRMAELHAQGSSRRAWTGGNIGRPLLLDLPSIAPGDLVVLELSSFQLELMTLSPHIAAILNITPNHLDRHGTMEVYTAAKARILDHQGERDTAILNREDPGAWSLRARVADRLMTFGREDDGVSQGTFVRRDQIFLRQDDALAPVCPLASIRLRGEHNVQNVLAACAIASAAGVEIPLLREAIESFGGVAHRLEFVRSVRGADWYNDSIGTAPERAMAAVRAFDEPLVLLAGGRDKDLPWDAWARLVTERVDHLVLFGEAAPKILAAVRALGEAERPFTLDVAQNLSQAVEVAARRAGAGDVVLLSPGGTSFDEFVDFEARGRAFRDLVERL